MSSLPWPWRFLVCAVVVVLYYWWGKRALFALAKVAAVRIPGSAHRRSQSELVGACELGFAAGSHVLVVVGLFVASGLAPEALGFTWTSALLIPLGVLLGVAEVALSMFLCQLLILWSTRKPLGTRPVPAAAGSRASDFTANSWTAMGRGGWIRHHLTTLSAFPLPFAMGLTTLQVSCEEVVFRGVFQNVFGDLGPAPAIALSGALFIGMQIFFMPNWRAAIFPVVGATVMATAHGVLFGTTGGILPLIAAHAVFFFGAVL